MFNWLFKKRAKSQLGIDLGSSAIKIVELMKKEGRFHLINYALAQPKKEGLILNELANEEVAAILKTLISEAKFSSRLANISLPVEKTFSTIMDVPIMPEKELIAAIPFEAQKYVPVPIEEVVLDWSVVPSSAQEQKTLLPDSTKVETGARAASSAAPQTSQSNSRAVPQGAPPASPELQRGEPASPELQRGEPASPELQRGEPASLAARKKFIRILLVAVPKEIISNLTKIAKLADLEVAALEQETFGLTRALVGSDSGIYLIVDLGQGGTDLIMVEQGLAGMSRSLDTINKEIVLMEIDRVVNIYQMRYNKKVSQCLLTGGRAGEKEFVKFLEEKLKIPVRPGDPLAKIIHPSILDSVSKELGLQLAAAVGLAMRE